MWLMYPIGPEDVRIARRGVWVLIGASLFWYVSLTLMLLVFSEPISEKIQGKFVEMPYSTEGTVPLLALLALFALSGFIRMVGYRFCRVLCGAVTVPESESLAQIGAAVYIGAVGTLYFGFTGLIALVAVAGSILELRFLRFLAAFFSACVGQDLVRRVHQYFYLRLAWLALIVPAGLVMLFSHIVIDLPANEGGPYQQVIRTFTNLFHNIFKLFSILALVTLPFVVLSYWYLLFQLQHHLPKILDPEGPIAPPEPPPRPGFDQLKEVLQPPTW